MRDGGVGDGVVEVLEVEASSFLPERPNVRSKSDFLLPFSALLAGRA